ncbi:MAG: protein kinase [Hamadaea sp.]|nr:protein kinase [Hamadaea sp.]
MGSVFLAKSSAGQIVAVKAIRRDLSSDPDFLRRFRSEVARARQVPAFCTAEVLDADPDHDPPYLVVEYVDGPSLTQVVESRGPLSEANLHGLAIAVATALTGIHGAGVIHRDLKPSNVLLSFGSAKVIDFGIARSADLVETNATDPNQLIGTVPYMAPERLSPNAGQTLTSAADIFAWGAVVTYAGTGRTPFGGGGVEAAARILLHEPDLTGLKGPLLDLVTQALSKDPAQRPTARELLDRLLTGAASPIAASNAGPSLIEAGRKEAVVAVPPGLDTTRVAPASPPPPPAAPRKRGRRLLAAVAAVLVLGSAAAAAVLTDGFGRLAGAVTPSASPSVSPSAAASPSPSPAGSIRFSNTLNEPGIFFRNQDDEEAKATCTVTGSLSVTKVGTGTYRCPGYDDPLTDFTLTVDVAVQTPDACGGIWLRFSDNKGYLLGVCGDKFRLWKHGKTLDRVQTFELQPLIKVTEWTKVSVVVRGSTITLLRNGTEVGAVSDLNTFTRGKVVLGIYVPSVAKATSTYQVNFRHLEIRVP